MYFWLPAAEVAPFTAAEVAEQLSVNGFLCLEILL
jgi:hypothetical protein